jgi:hypothetical protein
VLLRPALLLAVLALAACGGGSKQSDTGKSQLPPGCSVAEVEKIVNDFLATGAVAPAGSFDVFGSKESDGRKVLLRTPRAVRAWFRQRHALGERDRLIQLRVGKLDFNRARITFALTRAAPDFARRKLFTRLARGAGTVDCAHQKMAAWVMQGP